jgi:septal ring factor EnvC (AmiA/AmiB activator)
MGRLAIYAFLLIPLRVMAVDVVQQAESTRAKISESEVQSRDLLRELYTIQKRIKDISKSRSRLNGLMLSSDGDAQTLGQSVAFWKTKLEEQKHKLSLRLGLLYRWNSPNLLPFIFSSENSADFDRNMRSLKLISQRDFVNLQNFRQTVQMAHRQKSKLKSKVKSLIILRKQVEEEEAKLAIVFKQKTLFLERLKSEKEDGVKNLQAIRRDHPELEAIFRTGFYEKRGALTAPVAQKPDSTYGAIVDKTYRFRSLNKGWQFNTVHQEVHAVFDGDVVYVGKIPGYGQTTVVDHGDHYFSVYARLDKPTTKVSDRVHEGQIIAQAGPRLYFEIRHFADAIDPSAWIKDSKKEFATAN